MRVTLIALTMLLAASASADTPWKLLGSYVISGKRICTYQQGDATGTAVVGPEDKCPDKPKS